MYALTVDVLIRKAKFQPEIAMAVAEAIDVAIENAQLVTVPVLDNRLNALRVEMQALKAELVRWVFIVMLGNVALTAGATAILNVLQR